MNKDQKAQYIEDLAQDLSKANVFYLADTSALTVETINQLRRRCFQQGIELRVVKNTLLAKAMAKVEGRNYDNLASVLSGPTSIMFSEVGNAPAKLIADFRKKSPKPLLKGAYIDEAIFIGDDQLKVLESLKSKEELVGQIIGMLQSPAQNVLSALKGSGNTIAGILKTLEERA